MKYTVLNWCGCMLGYSNRAPIESMDLFLWGTMTLLSEKLAHNDDAENEAVDCCPLCDSRDSEFMFWNFDRRYHRPGKFGTHRCTGCRLIRLTPRPTVEAIDRHYPEEYGAYDLAPINEKSDRKYLRNALRDSVLYSLGYNKNASFVLKSLSPLLARYFLDRATYGYNELFPRFVESGSALEIGCGYGVFLAYLKRHGWKVAGVDLSPHAASRTKEQFNIDVFVGQVGEAPFKSESFDYVHLSHIVEHFFDPLQSLTQIFDLLK
ncbi:MAG: class I SAM-dependent methyltransferase, partial [Acidobacteriota bacterium]